MEAPTPNWLYFIGALIPLIPTLTYVFHQQKSPEDHTSKSNKEDSNEQSTSTPTLPSTATMNPIAWSLPDAPYKLLLCVNTDLSMGKGKIAAQCSHAAVACYKHMQKHYPRAIHAWEVTGCAKIAVKGTYAQLVEIQEKCERLGMPWYMVEDAGRTQIEEGSETVLGIGPAPVGCFQGLTDHLRLL